MANYGNRWQPLLRLWNSHRLPQAVSGYQRRAPVLSIAWRCRSVRRMSKRCQLATPWSKSPMKGSFVREVCKFASLFSDRPAHDDGEAHDDADVASDISTPRPRCLRRLAVAMRAKSAVDIKKAAVCRNKLPLVVVSSPKETKKKTRSGITARARYAPRRKSNAA